ncbi:MAG: SMC-Scp complex subunit ScpB [Mycobacteriales bacterium]
MLGDARPAAPEADITPEPELSRILEAILLVVDEPVSEQELAQVTERPREDVRQTLEALSASYRSAGRGFELRNVANGWRLYTSAACAAYVERFVRDEHRARLSQAALETLAIIAYRQPVTRQAIAAVRGVNVDGVVRTLLARGLIVEEGVDSSSGATLYLTTPYFLERLGLAQLADLPDLAPMLPDDLATITEDG